MTESSKNGRGRKAPSQAIDFGENMPDVVCKATNLPEEGAVPRSNPIKDSLRQMVDTVRADLQGQLLINARRAELCSSVLCQIDAVQAMLKQHRDVTAKSVAKYYKAVAEEADRRQRELLQGLENTTEDSWVSLEELRSSLDEVIPSIRKRTFAIEELLRRPDGEVVSHYQTMTENPLDHTAAKLEPPEVKVLEFVPAPVALVESMRTASGPENQCAEAMRKIQHDMAMLASWENSMKAGAVPSDVIVPPGVVGMNMPPCSYMAQPVRQKDVRCALDARGRRGRGVAPQRRGPPTREAIAVEARARFPQCPYRQDQMRRPGYGDPVRTTGARNLPIFDLYDSVEDFTAKDRPHQSLYGDPSAAEAAIEQKLHDTLMNHRNLPPMWSSPRRSQAWDQSGQKDGGEWQEGDWNEGGEGGEWAEGQQ